jgi:hypothetical protein
MMQVLACAACRIAASLSQLKELSVIPGWTCFEFAVILKVQSLARRACIGRRNLFGMPP